MATIFQYGDQHYNDLWKSEFFILITFNFRDSYKSSWSFFNKPTRLAARLAEIHTHDF